MTFDLIEARAAATPERPALWFEQRQYSYRDLDRRACRIASRLRQLGVRQGDRVSIVSTNHVAHFDLVLAAPKLGFVFSPLNPRLVPDELARQLDLVKPSVLFFGAGHEHLERQAGRVSLPLAGHEPWLAGGREAPVAPERPLQPDDLHMILFTSGSAGAPKGACLPYRQTAGNAEDTAARWGIGADDCAIQCTPCSHAAFNALSLPLLVAGGRVVLTPRFDPAEYLRLARAHRVTLLFMVPTMYRSLVDDAAMASTPLPDVRWAVTGGAPCPPALHVALAGHGIALHQGFGMTEAGTNCFDMGLGDADCGAGSVGRPLPRIEAVIRNADGSVTAAGTVGELTLAGPQICAGYFRAEDGPSTSRDAAVQGFRDGWLWTGDLARCDERGVFTICGRRKDIYISGGENIYPAEIEAALTACAAVAEACVFGWPHEKWGECGIAVVSLHGSARAEAASLRADLRRHLAGYKIPAEIMIVVALPKNGIGKIVKNEVRALYAAARMAREDVDAAA